MNTVSEFWEERFGVADLSWLLRWCTIPVKLESVTDASDVKLYLLESHEDLKTTGWL